MTPLMISVLLCLLFGFAGNTHGAGKEAVPAGQIVFSSNASGSWNLWTVKPDGKGLRALINSRENQHSPAISPDRQEIVYVGDERKIWIMNADGAKKKEIPLPKGIYAQPDWAPGGEEIAFVKYTVIPSDKSEIWRLKRENGEWRDPERLTTFPPMRLFPSFSPDGSMISYVEFRRDKLLGVIEEIGVMDLAEKRFETITDFQADSIEPAWSPSGDSIAYMSNQAGNYDIWIMSKQFDFDGSLLTEAITATFERRNTPLPNDMPMAFSEDFSSDISLIQRWKAFANKLKHSADTPSLSQITTELKCFLMPPLEYAKSQQLIKKRWQNGKWG